MEEEKAAAYYDELLLRGGGAARFKQGLGYGSESAPAHTERSIPTSMSNFVKESSPEKARALQNEIRVENIRDKLKKREVESGKRRSSSPATARHLKQPSATDEKFRDKERKRSFSRERRRSRSLSPDGARRKESGRRDGSRWHDRCRDRSSSRERRERYGGDSPRRSGRRDDSLSSSRGGNYDRRRRKDRSRSSDRDLRQKTDDSEFPGKNGREKETSLRKGGNAGIRGSRVASKAKDYSALIPNYETMTPSEKVKAKMRLQLSEASVKDSAKGVTEEWERFDFDKNAPLDDDAKLEGFGDDTGVPDDTGFLKHTGSTFLASANQAKRELDIQHAHDAAMFGVPSSVEENEKSGRAEKSGSLSDIGSASVIIDKAGGCVNSSRSFVSDEVVKMQQQGSWQERAKRLREERAAIA